MTRDEAVDLLLHSGYDQEVVAEMPDSVIGNVADTLVRNGQLEKLAEVAQTGFTVEDGPSVRLNPETGAWEVLVDEEEPVSNGYARGHKSGGKSKQVPMDPEDGEDPDDEDDEGESPAHNADFDVSSLPAHLRAKLAKADEVENQQKRAVIDEILADVPEADQSRLHQRLWNRSLEDLQDDLALHRSTIRNAGPTPIPSRLPQVPGDDLIPEGVSTPDRPVVRVGNKAGMTEEDWLRAAPPKLRRQLETAQQIENGERTQLVARIVANTADPVQRERAKDALASMSLGQLRDLAGALPVANRNGRRYAPDAGRTVSNRGTPDSLIPPRTNWAQTTTN